VKFKAPWGEVYGGSSQFRDAAEDVLAASEVGPLAALVEREARGCYDRIVRLHSAGRMPADRRRSFGQLLRRWQEFKTTRQGRWRGSDYVELASFRDELGRWSAELTALERGRATVSWVIGYGLGSYLVVKWFPGASTG
jgi:hypothetical protein